jgi:magnesium chelatase family protein
MAYGELTADTPEEPSSAIRARVNAARAFAAARLDEEDRNTHCNAALSATQLRKYCKLSPDAKTMMEQAFETMGLSARGHDRILRVARTIADLAGSETIEPAHLGEAIQMRSLDRSYW